MKHQLKNNPPLHFPVNYPKNPDQTTMNEASHRPPKSSISKLNFPIMWASTCLLSGQMIKTSDLMAKKVSTLGSLIFISLLKVSLALYKTLFFPALVFIFNLLDATNRKFIYLFEEFFRVMDSFFMIDVDTLQPAFLVDVVQENEYASAAFSTRNARQRPIKRFVAQTFPEFGLNYEAFMDSSKVAFKRKRKPIPTLFEFVPKMQQIKQNFEENISRLPLFTNAKKLQIRFAELKFLYYDRVFNFMDAVILHA